MRDSDINRCFKEAQKSVWYASPDPPTGDIAWIMELWSIRDKHPFR